MLGLRLFIAAYLSTLDEKLAKATSDLKYSTKEFQLKGFFSEKKGVKTQEGEINYQQEYSPLEIYYSRTPNHPIEEDFNQEELLRIGDFKMLQWQELQTDLNKGQILIHLHSLLDPNICHRSQNSISRIMNHESCEQHGYNQQICYLLCIGHFKVITKMPHSLLP